MSFLKKLSLFIICFIFSFTATCQEKFQEGIYCFSSELHDFATVKFYAISNGEIVHYYVNDDELIEKKSNEEGIQFMETSLINKNNAVATWINTCENCVWTETQTINIFYLGNPYIYKANHLRSVNNNRGEDCFENNKCFEVTTKGYVRVPPIAIFKDIKIGGKSMDGISIDAISLTSKTTEITLTIRTDVGGTLVAPGNDTTYEIFANSKQFKLLAQYGWNGNDTDGFGEWQTNEFTEKKFILFFEPMTVEDISKGFNLKEGNCDSGCWNFYDVRAN